MKTFTVAMISLAVLGLGGSSAAAVTIGNTPINPPPGGQNARVLSVAVPPFDFSVSHSFDGTFGYDAGTKVFTVANVANPDNFKDATLVILLKKGTTLPQAPGDTFDPAKGWPSLSSVGTVTSTGVSITNPNGDTPRLYMSWTIDPQPASEKVMFAGFSPLGGITSFTFTTECFASGGTPEPATWALMLIGIAGLGGAVRSRRGRAAGPDVF